MPISLYVKSPFILVVNPNLPVKTVPEFIKYAKESQAAAELRSVGAGGLQHLSMEFAKQRFGFDDDACAVPQHRTVGHRHRRGPRRRWASSRPAPRCR